MSASTVEARAPFSATRTHTRWLLALLFLIYCSNFIDRSIISTLGQAIKRDLSLSDAQLGALTGLVFALFYTGLGIPLARIAERKNRVAIIAICTAIWSVMTVLCGVAQNYGQLLVARMGVGVGEAGFTPCSQSLVADYYPPAKRATALATYCLGIPVGSLIGAAAGGWIVQHLNWRVAFMVVGAPGLAFAALALMTLKEPPRGWSEQNQSFAGPTPSLLAVVKTLCSKPSVLLAALAASFASISGYGITAFFVPYLIRRFGLNYTEAGLALGFIAGVPAGLSMMLGAWISDGFGARDARAYAWTPAVALLIAAPLCVLAFSQGNAVATIGVLSLAALAQQAYLAPTFSLGNNMVAPRMRATSIAILSFIWGLIGLGVGPLLTGVLSDRFAAQVFGVGRFASTCPGGGNAAPALAKACTAASAGGLQHALLLICGFYVLAAATYLLAARTLRRDLARG